MSEEFDKERRRHDPEGNETFEEWCAVEEITDKELEENYDSLYREYEEEISLRETLGITPEVLRMSSKKTELSIKDAKELSDFDKMTKIALRSIGAETQKQFGHSVKTYKYEPSAGRFSRINISMDGNGYVIPRDVFDSLGKLYCPSVLIDTGSFFGIASVTGETIETRDGKGKLIYDRDDHREFVNNLNQNAAEYSENFEEELGDALGSEVRDSLANVLEGFSLSPERYNDLMYVAERLDILVADAKGNPYNSSFDGVRCGVEGNKFYCAMTLLSLELKYHSLYCTPDETSRFFKNIDSVIVKAEDTEQADLNIVFLLDLTSNS